MGYYVASGGVCQDGSKCPGGVLADNFFISFPKTLMQTAISRHI
jgi:hypothetical protein